MSENQRVNNERSGSRMLFHYSIPLSLPLILYLSSLLFSLILFILFYLCIVIYLILFYIVLWKACLYIRPFYATLPDRNIYDNVSAISLYPTLLCAYVISLCYMIL